MDKNYSLYTNTHKNNVNHICTLSKFKMYCWKCSCCFINCRFLNIFPFILIWSGPVSSLAPTVDLSIYVPFCLPLRTSMHTHWMSVFSCPSFVANLCGASKLSHMQLNSSSKVDDTDFSPLPVWFKVHPVPSLQFVFLYPAMCGWSQQKAWHFKFCYSTRS